MNVPPKSRIITSCLILVLIACVCTSLILVSGLGISIYQNMLGPATPTRAPTRTFTPRPTFTPGPTLEPRTTEQPKNPPDPAATPAPQSNTDADMAILQSLASQAESTRLLTAVTAVPVTFANTDQLRQRVLDDFLGDYSPDDARQDALMLSTLGLMPSDMDLLKLYEELYTEQVSGFYEPETPEMVVRVDGALKAAEKFTYVHEYVHQLQDQYFDIRNKLGYSEEACEGNGDRCSAVSALIEGDATIASQEWLKAHADLEMIKELMAFAQEENTSPVFDIAPVFFQKDLVFPYEKGMLFVQKTFDSGGWEAVNALYQNPPASTEQIMHPERYPEDMPVAVTQPDLTATLGSGWAKLEEGVLGEWMILNILANANDPAQRLSYNTAADAAEGWGGDFFTLYTSEAGQPLLAVSSTWDTAQDTRDFAFSFNSYAVGRWGTASAIYDYTLWKTGSQTALLYYDETRLFTLWIIGPDEASVQAAFAALR